MAKAGYAVKTALIIGIIFLLTVFSLFVFFAALYATFHALFTHGDVWPPLAVLLIILYGAQEGMNSNRISSEISRLRADLTSAIALSDASIEALAQAFAEDEAAEKAQWN